MTTTTIYRIHNATSGHVFGVYAGESETHAIAAMLRDAGYAVTVDDDEIVFPASAPDSARDISDIVAGEWSPVIEIDETIASSDLSDDADWCETVRAACEAEIESALSSAYPSAEITVTVAIGSRSMMRVSLDAEHPATHERVKHLAREASQRGFDRACG